MAGFPMGGFHRSRHEVIHKGPVEDVSFIVVFNSLVHGRGNSLGQSAVDLPFHDHGVDDVPTIIDGHKSLHVDGTGFLIHFHHTDICPVGEGKVGRIVVMRCLESGFHSRGDIRVGGKYHFLNGL